LEAFSGGVMRGIVAAGLVVAMTAFVGCSEEPEPRFAEPSETPSASASEPTSSAAAEPEPWEEKSKAGAEAFVTLWVDTFNEALASGNTATLSRLSSNSCVSCIRFADRIETIVENGGSFQTKGWRVDDTNANDINGVQTSVALNVLIRAERVREAAGEPTQSFPATKVIYRADLMWVDGAWSMGELVDFE
jgi:hypothetical protein